MLTSREANSISHQLYLVGRITPNRQTTVDLECGIHSVGKREMLPTSQKENNMAENTPPEPCGYCRRCDIHDDPGGCLVVEKWERENPEAARAAYAPWYLEQLDREQRELEAARAETLASTGGVYEYESDEDTGLIGYPDGNGERW